MLLEPVHKAKRVFDKRLPPFLLTPTWPMLIHTIAAPATAATVTQMATVSLKSALINLPLWRSDSLVAALQGNIVPVGGPAQELSDMT